MPSRVWEKELSKTLDITWGDASKALKLAKIDLEISPKDYPEDRKEEVFALCEDIVNSEAFVKTKKPEVATREEIIEKSHPNYTAKTSSEGFEDEQQEQAPSKEEEEEAEKSKKNTIIAVAILVVVVVIVIIIGVAVNRNNGSEEEAAPATDAPEATEAPIVSSSGSETADDTTEGATPSDDCSLQTFTGEELIATLAVTSSITAVELDYIGSVLKRSYESLDFCDPYCRTLTGVSIESAEIVDGSVTGDCDSTLVMTLSVDGTYLECGGDDGSDAAFPGFLEMPAAEARSGGGSLRALQTSARSLQQQPESCEKSCMDDASVPSFDEFASMVDGYVNVLGPVCKFISMEYV